jgi:hypothetical protein
MKSIEDGEGGGVRPIDVVTVTVVVMRIAILLIDCDDRESCKDA